MMTPDAAIEFITKSKNPSFAATMGDREHIMRLIEAGFVLAEGYIKLDQAIRNSAAFMAVHGQGGYTWASAYEPTIIRQSSDTKPMKCGPEPGGEGGK